MAYQTIRDLVAHIRSLHGRLRETVQDARMRANDERSALLLDFINQHEAALERAVEIMRQRGGEAVLDTWLQFEQGAEVGRAMRRSEAVSLQSDDEIVGHVLQTENSLVRLYELLQGSTSSASVQSFFQSLLDFEHSAVRRAARVKLEAGDF